MPFRHDGHISTDKLPSHLLWMTEEMPSWDTRSIKKAVKAGRWIGWMYRGMEELLLWSNVDSRNWAREDSHSGFDIPH